jgi:beta-N-acetylhexosaminidase
MQMRNVIGQHIFIGVQGKSLTEHEKKFIVENNIGGITLFGRNCESPEQIRQLCAEIQSLRHRMKDKVPLFIAIDMEGGRVARLKSPFTQWPAAKKLGELDSPTASFNFAYMMGLELKAVGINLDFAPCIDVLTNPTNTAIGDRAISSDPEMVAKHSSALIRGYIKAEVIPCAKHFPGHGNTVVDSHFELPVEATDMATLQNRELIPFKKAFKSRLEMVMTSHLLFKKIDPEWPVTLSEIFLKNLLRTELRYKGFIISDDLGMKAMSDQYSAEKIPVRALQAGVNFLLYCNEFDVPPVAISAIEKAISDKTLNMSDLDENYKKILAWKKEKLTQPEPLDLKSAAQIIGHADHFKLSQAIFKKEVPPGLV